MFGPENDYCEKLADDFHLTHLQPYNEILEKADGFSDWPNIHIAAHTPSYWLMKEPGIQFFNSVYGKGTWMCMLFRLPPNHLGKIHADGTYDTYNFIVRGVGGTRWHDESKLTLVHEMKNFVKAGGTGSTRIYEDHDEYVFECKDVDYPNNHLHINIPHSVYNPTDESRFIITVRPADAGVQAKVDQIGEILLMKYYVGRDWNKPMDVNEWLDNYIKEKFNNN